ncbi:hypothetical protein SM124_09790 [Bacillus sp. 31A1R]|uniref:Zinc ribbon domain-containing protein n=1 Tax=Robertmurraya mangrovi TaxID=3098077 RepID=A0ABU5IY18_9BACI|nr:hypothetical protein [Bacillus sp. 31A1R]MDZ5472037.1 hypothetical protein [Bacillus sp. 31A1R]
MYCKTCGEKGSPKSLYCINDGTLLSPINVKFKASGKRQFCQDCGSKGNGQDNYCLSCGSSMTQFAKSKAVALGGVTVPKVEVSQLKENLNSSIKIPSFSLGTIKNAIIPVIVSFIVLFLLAFAVLSTSQNFMNSLVEEGTEEFDINYMLDMLAEETDKDIPKMDEIFGIMDMVMLSNLQNLNFNMEIKGDYDGEEGSMKGELKIENGSIIYLLIPFISLFIGGVVLGVQNRSNSSKLSLTLIFSILYALILSIVSLFSGFSFKEKFNEEYFNISVDIGTDYSFFTSLLLGFVLAFIFAGLGTLFANNYRKTTGHLAEFSSYGEAVHQAFSTVVRGVLLTIVVVIAILSVKVKEFKDDLGFIINSTPLEELLDKSYIFITTTGAQIGSYVWNLLHLVPLTFSLNEEGEKGSITYSIFSGFTTDGEAKDSDIYMLEKVFESSDVSLYLKLGLLVPILLLLWAGFNIAKQSNQLYIKLAVFSIIYALLMGGLASLTDLGFSGIFKDMTYSSGEKMEMGMFLGYSPVGTFIRSFLFAFLLAYLGTWLRKLKES